MPHYPDFATFSRLASDVHLVPVYRRLIADALTPVSAFHLLDAGACACLFESVVGGEKVGRYSFLAADPFLQIEARGQRMKVVAEDRTEEFDSADPLAELKRHVERFRAARLPELPPFTSGAVGYAGYDVVRYTERLPNAPPDDRRLPDLSFAFYDRMVVFDNITKTITVVAMARVDGSPQDGESKGSGTRDLEMAYSAAKARVDETVAQLSRASADLAPVDIELA